MPDAAPDRFTGAVFVAEEKPLGAGFDAALTGLLNLRRGGVLISEPVGAKLGIAGGGSDQVQGSEGQGQGYVHR